MDITYQSLSDFLRERLKETPPQAGGDQLPESKSDSPSEQFPYIPRLQVHQTTANLPRWAEARRAYGMAAAPNSGQGKKAVIAQDA